MDRDAINAALGGRRGVVALVTGTRGSAPRNAGAAMVITDQGTFGTLGGGAVEHSVLQRAREMLAGCSPARAEMEFPLNPALDQCCGGVMQVAVALVEGGVGRTLWPDGPALPAVKPGQPVTVYGAGHVGRAVIAALAPLDFALTWVDAQAGRMGGAPAGVRTVESPLPEAEAKGAPPDAIHLVMTHSHAVDLEIVTAILSGPFGRCGLIGSKTKRARFEKRLTERGIASEAIAALECPIGLPGLTDKRPAAIAASVAADLLMHPVRVKASELA